MITVMLNGKPREFPAASTVAGLLTQLDVDPRQVAVALNGEVVPRRTWSHVLVADGDAVEIVRAVGGGT